VGGEKQVITLVTVSCNGKQSQRVAFRASEYGGNSGRVRSRPTRAWGRIVKKGKARGQPHLGWGDGRAVRPRSAARAKWAHNLKGAEKNRDGHHASGRWASILRRKLAGDYGALAEAGINSRDRKELVRNALSLARAAGTDGSTEHSNASKSRASVW